MLGFVLTVLSNAGTCEHSGSNNAWMKLGKKLENKSPGSKQVAIRHTKPELRMLDKVRGDLSRAEFYRFKLHQEYQSRFGGREVLQRDFSTKARRGAPPKQKVLAIADTLGPLFDPQLRPTRQSRKGPA